MPKHKLLILTSHPIQYQAPLFQKLAALKNLDLTVYFCWRAGSQKKYYDKQFGKEIVWDLPLLNDYNYKFLNNFSLKPSSDFFGQINPGIIKELINLRSSQDQRSCDDQILIVFGWNSFTNWLAFLAAFILKIPVLLHGENPLNQELLKSAWKIKIKKIILGWLFKHVSVFLYIGEENKKFYQLYGVPEEKLFFCPYAVDNTRFINEAKNLKSQISSQRRGSPQAANLKNELGINRDSIVILFGGKLIEKKRPMDLLMAYELILRTSDVPNIDDNFRTSDVPKLNSALIFVGDGVLRPELEKYAKEYNLQSVYFVGFQNQTKLPKYYALADIFVLPSGTGETWGLMVNEAMCFGLPIIVSDIVGCGADLVKHGENGYIFSTGNIKKLADYLTDLIRNSEKRKKFGKKSFEIIQKYSHDSDIESILNTIQFVKNHETTNNHLNFKERILCWLATLTRKWHPRGIERFLRLIHNPDNCVGFDTIIPYDKTLKLHINTAFFTEWFIFFKGYYEEPLIKMIKKYLPQNGTFVDVGANIGDTTLVAAKIAKNVIAIEPVPAIAARLQRNCELNKLNNVRIIQSAVSNKKGTISFYLAGSGMHSGMGSLYAEHAKGAEIKVRAETLDEIVGDSNVDFIKIDTEGHDRNVIMGAKETIIKNKPIIIYENADDCEGLSDIQQSEIDRFLYNLGYKQEKFDAQNILCMPVGKNEACKKIL